MYQNNLVTEIHRVPLEMLTVVQAAQKLLTFYENQRFIAVFMTARN
jgi:hypothetical protein